MFPLKNFFQAHDRVEVLNVQLFGARILAVDAHVVGKRLRQHDIAAVQRGADGCGVVQPVQPRRPLAQIFRVQNAFARPRGRALQKGKQPAVVAEPVNVGLLVLPCPILGQKFAVFVGVCRHKAVLFGAVLQKCDQVGLPYRPHDLVFDGHAGLVAGEIKPNFFSGGRLLPQRGGGRGLVRMDCRMIFTHNTSGMPHTCGAILVSSTHYSRQVRLLQEKSIVNQVKVGRKERKPAAEPLA